MTPKVTIKVNRFDPSVDKKPSIQSFEVPVEEGMVVLDAIHYIQNNLDTTLAARWNCKAAKCGSCSAEINGKPSLMCKTRIDEVGPEVTVKPIKAYPVVKDLVTDISYNWTVAKRIAPFTPMKAELPWKIDAIDVKRAQEFKKCIECFLCQDVCHVIREHNEKYVGPKHMVKIASLDLNPMDTVDRSRWLHTEGGAGYCNITKCCQEVCPEEIRITDNAIIPEKERIVGRYYDPIAMLVHRVRRKK